MKLPGLLQHPDFRAALVLIAACGLVFGQVVGFEFVDWDDPVYVSENPKVQLGLTVDNLKWAFTTHFYGLWHPLAWLSHMADVMVWGAWPGGHHLTSLLLHTGTTLLLYRFFREATGSVWRSAGVAFLFAAHPLHVESVAWVAERKDVLCGFFWVAGMVAHGRYVRAPSVARYAWLVLWVALALLAKPMAVTLPFALLLLDIWPLRRWTPASAPWKSLAGLLREKAILFALVIAYLFLMFDAPSTGAAAGAAAGTPFAGWDIRLTNAAISYWQYLLQTALPLDLVFYYPMHMAPPDWLAPLALAGLGLVVLAAVAMVRTRPFILVGVLWYIGTLVPVIGLVPIAAHAQADRYTYLPLIGIFALLAWWLPAWRGTWPRLALAALGLLVAGLAWQQVGVWKDSETLFRRGLVVDEGNFMAHRQLASVLVRQGQLDEAERHARRAIELAYGRDLEFAVAIVQGDVELARGQSLAALARYSAALASDPGAAMAHDRMGMAYLEIGSADNALGHFNQALALNPLRMATLAAIGRLAWQTGNHEQARYYARMLGEGRLFGAEAIQRTADLYLLIGDRQAAADLVMVGLRRYPRDAPMRALSAAIGGHPGN